MANYNTTNQNSLQKVNYRATSKPKFSTELSSNAYQTMIANTLQDKRTREKFVADISSVVANNPALQECTTATIVSAGLTAASLNLPLAGNLGYAYIVPFKDKKTGTVKAQFQLGYKGMIQLAIRSGEYTNIDAFVIKEGELKEFNPIDGFKFDFNSNYEERKRLKTIGYVATFTLRNGFKKNLYISYEEMLDHADKYSQAFDKDTFIQLQNGTYKGEAWKLSSFWYKSFDDMALKTVLRRLLSKYGIMSVDMQTGYERDQAVVNVDGTVDYVDNPSAYNVVESTEEVLTEEEQQQANIDSIISKHANDTNIPQEELDSLFGNE